MKLRIVFYIEEIQSFLLLSIRRKIQWTFGFKKIVFEIVQIVWKNF